MDFKEFLLSLCGVKFAIIYLSPIHITQRLSTVRNLPKGCPSTKSNFPWYLCRPTTLPQKSQHSRHSNYLIKQTNCKLQIFREPATDTINITTQWKIKVALNHETVSKTRYSKLSPYSNHSNRQGNWTLFIHSSL